MAAEPPDPRTPYEARSWAGSWAPTPMDATSPAMDMSQERLNQLKARLYSSYSQPDSSTQQGGFAQGSTAQGAHPPSFSQVLGQAATSGPPQPAPQHRVWGLSPPQWGAAPSSAATAAAAAAAAAAQVPAAPFHLPDNTSQDTASLLSLLRSSPNYARCTQKSSRQEVVTRPVASTSLLQPTSHQQRSPPPCHSAFNALNVPSQHNAALPPPAQPPQEPPPQQPVLQQPSLQQQQQQQQRDEEGLRRTVQLQIVTLMHKETDKSQHGWLQELFDMTHTSTTPVLQSLREQLDVLLQPLPASGSSSRGGGAHELAVTHVTSGSKRRAGVIDGPPSNIVPLGMSHLHSARSLDATALGHHEGRYQPQARLTLANSGRYGSGGLLLRSLELAAAANNNSLGLAQKAPDAFAGGQQTGSGGSSTSAGPTAVAAVAAGGTYGGGQLSAPPSDNFGIGQYSGAGGAAVLAAAQMPPPRSRLAETLRALGPHGILGSGGSGGRSSSSAMPPISALAMPDVVGNGAAAAQFAVHNTAAAAASSPFLSFTPPQPPLSSNPTPFSLTSTPFLPRTATPVLPPPPTLRPTASPFSYAAFPPPSVFSRCDLLQGLERSQSQPAEGTGGSEGRWRDEGGAREAPLPLSRAASTDQRQRKNVFTISIEEIVKKMRNGDMGATHDATGKPFQIRAATQLERAASAEYEDQIISPDSIQKVYDRPLKEAAKVLSVSIMSLKRTCRKMGVSRWPYRKLASLSELEVTVRDDQLEQQLLPEDKQAVMQYIEAEKARIIVEPDRDVDPVLQNLRKAKIHVKYEKWGRKALHRAGSQPSASAAAGEQMQQQQQPSSPSSE